MMPSFKSQLCKHCVVLHTSYSFVIKLFFKFINLLHIKPNSFALFY